MRWFFALHESAPHFGAYADMIKVAVVSARRHTALRPHFLYDGRPNELTAWLERQGAVVVPVRSRLLPDLERLAASTGNRDYLHYGPGVYLRLEVPRICAERGWDDDTVLYTDCDILFTGDPAPLWPDLQGRFFGVAPEENPDDKDAINSGVMLMRLPALRGMDAVFGEFTREILPECLRYSWDQHAYREFFRHGWAHLPAELNWKPYWGESAQARIVHFHGPKPFLRASLRDGTALPVQRQYAGGAFEHYCALWDDALAEAGRT